MGRSFKILLVSAVALLLGVAVAFAMGLLTLPPDLVQAFHSDWMTGSDSPLDVTLSSVPPGYSVMNGTYAGWCLEDNHMDDVPDGSWVLLLDSSDSSINCPTGSYSGIDWRLINYLLNHQQGEIEDVQAAMWELAGTSDPQNPTFPITPAVNAMVTDAYANGGSFMPGPGDVVAAILCGDGIGPRGFQDTIIEVPVQPFEGCTPGYWKQEHHFDSWPEGIDPYSFMFRDAFGVGPNDVLLARALRRGGGGVNALMRHAAAAYLNAASDEVLFSLNTAQVVSIVQRAWNSRQFEAGKNLLEAANEDYGCPLN